MSLTTEDINAVRAQWEEWVADPLFTLTMDVRAEQVGGSMIKSDGLASRIQAPSRYVSVRIHKAELHGNRLLFSQRVPHDARALRTEVQMLARAIAEHIEEQTDAG